MLGTENKPASIERLPTVMARTGMKKSWIYREIAAGRFPASVRLASNAVGWLSHEVNEWILHKIEGRAANA